MAKKTASTINETAVIINPVKIESSVITIVGDTPLIIHSWSEKAKKEILDNQQGKKKGKKQFHVYVAILMVWLIAVTCAILYGYKKFNTFLLKQLS